MSSNPFEFFAPVQQPLPSQGLINAYLDNLKTPSQTVPSQRPPPPEKSLIEKITDAIARIRRIIAQDKLAKGSQLQWVAYVKNCLKPIYGEQSQVVATFSQWQTEIARTALSTEQFLRHVEQVEHLLGSFNARANAGSLVTASRASLIPTTKNVFIIHGHNELNRLRLCALVQGNFGLNPIVLLDKPGRSAPTIEKFEEQAKNCSFAIALFTADDNVTAKSGNRYDQARPNVIFETGWFVGRLGKDRVLILLQKGAEIHSDFDGVNRVEFKENLEDKFLAIQNELGAAGLL